MVYVLTHGTFQILDTPHKGEILGQKFELPEELAKSAIGAGASLLPESEFNAIGFTPEEIAKHPNARRQAGAPALFASKHAQALEAVCNYRQNLLTEAKS